MERYQFLRWGQQAFANFRVVPPGTGICHQVNLEYLAQTVWTRKEKDAKSKKTVEYAFPDTLVGTDSHTTMVNGLSVLGWGVGGIEAEAAMLGQPISMLIPEVIGFKLTGKLREGVTATDLVLTVTQMLRKKGVVGKFVEYYGPGLDDMSLEDRATIANMAPEYGATCGFFPIDAETLRYLKDTARKPARVALVEKYAKAQGLFRTAKSADPVFTDTLSLDLDTVEPSLAGPARPQDRVPLGRCRARIRRRADEHLQEGRRRQQARQDRRHRTFHRPWRRRDRGDHVVHQHLQPLGDDRRRPRRQEGGRARVEGAPLGEDLAGAGQPGRHRLSGEGRASTNISTSWASSSSAMAAPPASAIRVRCRTMSPMRSPPAISSPPRCCRATAISKGRVHPQVRANYLASPMLVVAYALAGFDQHRSDQGAGRLRQGERAGLSQGHLAEREGNLGRDAQGHQDVQLQGALRQRLRGRRQLAQDQGDQEPDLQLADGFDLCEEPALLRRHDDRAAAGEGDRQGAHPGAVRRLHHHRPHLARRQHQGGGAGRRLSAGAPGAASRISTPMARGAAISN